MEKLFKFEKRDIVDKIRYEMDLFSKVRKPITFIIETLINLGHSITLTSLEDVELNNVKPNKGKNYNWFVVKFENIELLIRTYGTHFTIFTKANILRGTHSYTEYGAFTFFSDIKKMTPEMEDKMHEAYYENPFIDLNVCIKNIIELILKGSFHSLWNSVSLPRPKHVEIKIAYNNEEISSLDNFAFCLEEIDSIYLELFAQTTMFEKLKTLSNRIGEQFDRQYIIKEIRTELKDDYYHGVGIVLIDKDDKTKFVDVYSLSAYYYGNVFTEL